MAFMWQYLFSYKRLLKKVDSFGRGLAPHPIDIFEMARKVAKDRRSRSHIHDLVQRLDNMENNATRHIAIRALRAMDAVTGDGLIGKMQQMLMNDEHPPIRMEALRSLEHFIHRSEVRASIEAAANDKEPYVGNHARRLLGEDPR